MSVNVGTNWRWSFDESNKTLLLLQSNGDVIDTQLTAKQLVPDAQLGDVFDLDDANNYQLYYEHAAGYLDVAPAELEQIAAKATAARRFFKPTMPQSWFFVSSSAHLTLDHAYVVEMDTQSGSGQFLAIEVAEKAALFMLLSDSLTLSESRTMQRGDIIKVMNDRVARYATNTAFMDGYSNISA